MAIEHPQFLLWFARLTQTLETPYGPCMSRRCDFPVFDADNHLYKTRDAFTRHLPDKYKGAVDYTEVNGRTKIMIRGVVSEYIPTPTFDVVARPGARSEGRSVGKECVRTGRSLGELEN